jgi:hypothetical protein
LGRISYVNSSLGFVIPIDITGIPKYFRELMIVPPALKETEVVSWYCGVRSSALAVGYR